MKRIICLRGIPASWKTTWRKWFTTNFFQYSIASVNKDDIRKEKGLTWNNWNVEKEKEVVKTEREIVNTYIKEWMEIIIIDNTHLWKNNKHIEYYRVLANENWYEFVIQDFVVSLEEAIRRDKNRPKEEQVGEEVIRNMYDMWLDTFNICQAKNIKKEDTKIKEDVKIRNKQVGWNHYSKYSIQPWDIIDTYKLDFYEGNLLKYLLRYKDKNGLEDLEKAKHYLEKIILNLKNK